MTQIPQYLKIAEELAEKIRCGYYQPGEKIFSQQELADGYNVSIMVSYKVHSKLLEWGYVKKIHGKGVFVTYHNQKSFYTKNKRGKIKKIVLFYFRTTLNPDPHNYVIRMISGIKQRAIEKALTLRFEFINLNNTVAETPVVPPQIYPNEGCIVFFNGLRSMHASAGYLLDPNVRTVLTNAIIPGSASVMPDNFNGMLELVQHVVSKGHKKIIFASKFAFSPTPVIEEERNRAFEFAASSHGVEWKVINSGNYNELLKLARLKDGPTAFMFSEDSSALRFKELMDLNSIHPLPYVTGFDDYVPNIKDNDKLMKLTTYHVDCEKMGEAAVDVLCMDTAGELKSPSIKYVPGRLLIRN